MGVSGSSIARLQMVQNATAGLLIGTREYEHVSLHWLPIPFRMNLFAYKALSGLASPYFSELLCPYVSYLVFCTALWFLVGRF